MTASGGIEQLRALDQKLSDPELDPDLAFQLFENCPDGIIIVDSAGVVRFVNRQAELMFGYPKRELIAKRIEMLLPEEARDRHVAHRANYIAEPRIRPMGLGQRLHGATKDGQQFEAEINLSPMITTHGTFIAAYIRKKR